MPGESEQAFFDSLRPPIEAVRLAEFTKQLSGGNWLEIGCGNGFITLYLAACHPKPKHIAGIDLNAEKIIQAKEFQKKFEGVFGQPANVEFMQQDVRTLQAETIFDGIVCNPPFFATGASRPSPNVERRAARQDIALSLTELFETSKRLLKPEGRLSLVFPGFRYEELRAIALQYGYTIDTQKHLPDVRKRNNGVWLIAFRRDI